MLTPARIRRLRAFYRYWNPMVVWLWKRGVLRPVNPTPWGSQYMVIRHVGRKSGLFRYTPVTFAVVDGEIYCASSFGTQSDWYRNIRADPRVQLWLPGEICGAIAQDISPSTRRIPILRRVLVCSGLAPRMAGIDPVAMDDETLAHATAGHRLIHMQRTQAAAPGLDLVQPSG